ncbi:hypothetical protein [Nitrosomonas marina]|uniref:Uncharacterized protein n=1 Tax=Nitrosomonas marina TaxID=917 RepID=A0A1H8GJW0_9PROT|nr:hypothetical protein [Nitrosomonas marina]SEN44296.1 hypothetical protein SAMN05216325_11867 [Nitrosomonas marina]
MNDVNDLREILFDTLKDLRNEERPMDIDRAKAVSDVAQTIINTAKIEIDHAKITGSSSSSFITEEKPTGKLPTGSGYVHKLRG